MSKGHQPPKPNHPSQHSSAHQPRLVVRASREACELRIRQGGDLLRSGLDALLRKLHHEGNQRIGELHQPSLAGSHQGRDDEEINRKTDGGYNGNPTFRYF